MAEEQRRQHVARVNRRQFVHRDVSSLAAEWVMLSGRMRSARGIVAS